MSKTSHSLLGSRILEKIIAHFADQSTAAMRYRPLCREIGEDVGANGRHLKHLVESGYVIRIDDKHYHLNTDFLLLTLGTS